MLRKLRERAAAMKTIAALLTQAEQIARARGTEQPAAEDLERIGVRPDDDRISAELPPPGEPAGIYRSEPSAQELLQAAGADARRGGGTMVGAHVLGAAAGLEHGPTARALRRMGVDRAELRAATSAEIESRAGG